MVTGSQLPRERKVLVHQMSKDRVDVVLDRGVRQWLLDAIEPDTLAVAGEDLDPLRPRQPRILVVDEIVDAAEDEVTLAERECLAIEEEAVLADAETLKEVRKRRFEVGLCIADAAWSRRRVGRCDGAGAESEYRKQSGNGEDATHGLDPLFLFGVRRAAFLGQHVVAIRTSTYARTMERLDTRDTSALLAFVSDLRDVDDPLPFPPRVLHGLEDLIPCDRVNYSELDPLERRSRLLVWTGGRAEDVMVGAPVPEEFWTLRPTHPVCGHRLTSGDWKTPLKASDFLPLAGFRRTAIYDALYRGELDHWFDFGLLSPQPDRTRMFIFTRKAGPDFTERDRLVASLIRPHLEARATAAEDSAQAADALATVEEQGVEETQTIVVCSADGMIEFASRRSRALLRRYLGLDNGRLPSALLERERLTFAEDDGRLTIRVVRTGGLRFLLLEEQDRRLERLTAREREVLDGVARGRTNREIALDLGLASATVAKHLEHVYDKLGVRTRTAAATLAAGGGGRAAIDRT